MTVMQEQAIITLAADEIYLMQLEKREKTIKKQKAIRMLENLDLSFPKDFAPDEELHKALEEKYHHKESR